MRRPRNSGCVTKDKKFGTAAKLRPGRQTNGTPSPGNSHHLMTVFHSLNGRLCTSMPFHFSRFPDAAVAAVGKTQFATSRSKRKQAFLGPCWAERGLSLQVAPRSAKRDKVAIRCKAAQKYYLNVCSADKADLEGYGSLPGRGLILTLKASRTFLTKLEIKSSPT